MKKLVPFVLCSTAMALGLGAVSARAGLVTPRVPPRAARAATQSANDLLSAPKGLTVWSVTTVADGGPGSLRQAIADAAPGDRIIFAVTLPATIVLSNTLVISQDLSVVGPGPDQLTIMRSDATNTPLFRVFTVEAGVVTLSGVAIRNGVAYDASSFADNVGGGILNRGTLTVSNCVIAGNTAPTTSLNGSDSVGFGGGVFSDVASGLTLINSTISGNQASGAGGGICTLEATNFAEGCTVSGNFAGVQGGGINYQGRTATWQNCTIANNTTLKDGDGSAVANVVFGTEDPTLLTLTACTLAGNTGSTNEAILVAGLNDSRGALTNRMLSCLVAANTGPNFGFLGTVSFQSLGNNLDSDGSSGLVNGVNGDQVGTVASPIDAKLGPLQANGGLTATMALLPGSPAIDKGACADANGAPLLTDQRGFPRPQGLGCDIGAYESQPLTLICPPGVVVEFTSITGAVATFSATVASVCPHVTTVYTPPSGSMFPIGVTPVQVRATDSCGNTAHCGFTVTVLGALGVKSNVLAELKVLRAGVTNNADRRGLDEAIADVSASLGLRDPRTPLWVDQTHLNRRNGGRVFFYEKDAVSELQEILRNRWSQIPDATVQNLINRLVKCDRLLAVVSIQDAASAGMNPRKIAQDLQEVARGDQDAAAGRPTQAIQHYWNAWSHSAHPQVCVRPDPYGGGTHVQFLGDTAQVYVIQASSNLLNWVTIGTATPDGQGDVDFIDPDAGNHSARFYRVLDQ